jgi:hypothetical protein
MLLLDEFQTWYDGLTNTKQYPWKNWAFNLIQILSEIAKEHPDLLVLVISVRNGGSDAYQQVHRVNPVPIDFKAGTKSSRVDGTIKKLSHSALRCNWPTAASIAGMDPGGLASQVSRCITACWLNAPGAARGNEGGALLPS